MIRIIVTIKFTGEFSGKIFYTPYCNLSGHYILSELLNFKEKSYHDLLNYLRRVNIREKGSMDIVFILSTTDFIFHVEVDKKDKVDSISQFSKKVI